MIVCVTGALDANTVHIIPKNRIIDPPAPTNRRRQSSSSGASTSMSRENAKRLPGLGGGKKPPPAIPFEQTYRLQVKLPKNQLAVLRVGQRTLLGEVRDRVCWEKSLDPAKYELRHPGELAVMIFTCVSHGDNRSTPS